MPRRVSPANRSAMVGKILAAPGQNLPHWARAAPANAAIHAGPGIAPSAASRAATLPAVVRSGPDKDSPRISDGHSFPRLSALVHRRRLAQPAAAVAPTTHHGLTSRRTSVAGCASNAQLASANAIAAALYRRPASSPRGPTTINAPHWVHLYRRSRSVMICGGPVATSGPCTCRLRNPWPCSRSRCPGGRLATWQPGHRPGRAASTDGTACNQCLTSTSICTNR